MDLVIVLIIFFFFLLINNLFVIEGFNDKSLPPGNPLPYPKGNGPPLSPPEIKPKTSPKEINTENISQGQPSYCGCINMQTRALYNENTNLLTEIKNKIETLTTSATKLDSLEKKTQ